eukprot:scaffold46071_cov36-Phaeocystis_antarctica.AAC.1
MQVKWARRRGGAAYHSIRPRHQGTTRVLPRLAYQVWPTKANSSPRLALGQALGSCSAVTWARRYAPRLCEGGKLTHPRQCM